MASNKPDAEQQAAASDQRTIQSYEANAQHYAASVPKDPSPQMIDVMNRMVAIAGKGNTILEIGSGPGWDADFIELLGVTVRRTDATAAFRSFQEERGKTVYPLNVVTDELGGPYAGVMAFYVLQHIDRQQLPLVINKIADALRPGGAFLVCISEGDDESWQHGENSGQYLFVRWNEANFVDILNTAGLDVLFTTRHTDNEGDWMTFVAQKR